MSLHIRVGSEEGTGPNSRTICLPSVPNRRAASKNTLTRALSFFLPGTVLISAGPSGASPGALRLGSSEIAGEVAVASAGEVAVEGGARVGLSTASTGGISISTGSDDDGGAGGSSSSSTGAISIATGDSSHGQAGTVRISAGDSRPGAAVADDGEETSIAASVTVAGSDSSAGRGGGADVVAGQGAAGGGALRLAGGTGPGDAAGGDATLEAGRSEGSRGGSVSLSSGRSGAAAAGSGAIAIATADSSSTGDVVVGSGDATDGPSGVLTLRTGDSAHGEEECLALESESSPSCLSLPFYCLDANLSFSPPFPKISAGAAGDVGIVAGSSPAGPGGIRMTAGTSGYDGGDSTVPGGSVLLESGAGGASSTSGDFVLLTPSSPAEGGRSGSVSMATGGGRDGSGSGEFPCPFEPSYLTTSARSDLTFIRCDRKKFKSRPDPAREGRPATSSSPPARPPADRAARSASCQGAPLPSRTGGAPRPSRPAPASSAEARYASPAGAT